MDRHQQHHATRRRDAAPASGATPDIRVGKVRSARQAIRQESEYVERTIDRTVERILATLDLRRRP